MGQPGFWNIDDLGEELRLDRTIVPEKIDEDIAESPILGEDSLQFLPFAGGGELEGTLG
jgi:hypothetical protein